MARSSRSTGVAASAKLDERVVRRWPAIAAWGRCGSATRPIGRSSTTPTAPSILAANARLLRREAVRAAADARLFQRLEPVGERALAMHDQPDAGLWELRTQLARPHLLERDVLGRLRPARARSPHVVGAARARAVLARSRPRHPRGDRRAGLVREARQAFVASFGGGELDASASPARRDRLPRADDPRFVATVAALESALMRR